MQPRSILNDAELMVTSVAMPAFDRVGVGNAIGHRYCRLQSFGPFAVEEQLDLEPSPERIEWRGPVGMFSLELHEVNWVRDRPALSGS